MPASILSTALKAQTTHHEFTYKAARGAFAALAALDSVIITLRPVSLPCLQRLDIRRTNENPDACCAQGPPQPTALT